MKPREISSNRTHNRPRINRFGHDIILYLFFFFLILTSARKEGKKRRAVLRARAVVFPTNELTNRIIRGKVVTDLYLYTFFIFTFDKTD